MKRRFTKSKGDIMHFFLQGLPASKLFICLLLFCLPLLLPHAYGQNSNDIVVTGTVRDASGSSLPGVTVRLKGNAKTGAVSGPNGRFLIRVPNKNSMLVFSFVGFSSLEQPVNGTKELNIVLLELKSDLNEIVVIGYGTVKRKDLTGSVSEVNMIDLQKAPVATFDEALAGRVAGVQVSSGDGQPGASTNIVIRGGNSLTQDNAPLYVIDGFISEQSLTSVLSPNDIESITVLKDASATAIYGSRGANGVIIVQTKKGKAGKPVVTYQASVGNNKVTKQIPLMSPYEFVKYQLEINPSLAPSYYLTGPGRTLDDYQNIAGINWQDKLFQSGFTQQHNLSLTGGTADTRYAISGSIFDLDGVVVNSGYNRYQGRIFLEQRISKKFKATLNINTGKETSFGVSPASERTTSSQPYSTALMYAVWGSSPVSVGVDLNDAPIDPEANDARFNPYVSALNELNTRTTNTLLINGKLDYAISNKLSLSIQGSINNSVLLNKQFYSAQTSKGYPFPDNALGVNGSISNGKANSWLNENLLTYNTKVGSKNNLNIIGGVTIQKNTTESNGFAAKNIPNPDLGIGAISQGVLSSLTYLNSGSTLVSALARANYNIQSKYLFTASFRADGSSKFADGNKWGYFPSGAFAWSIGRERFMKNIPVVSDSKLRLSYGLTGNNRVGDFPTLSSVSFPYNNYYSFNNQTPQAGAILGNYGNKDLKWETTAQFDFGYDLSLLKDRINLTADFYRKTTYNLLLNANVPYSTGYTSILENIGKVQNQGLEFSLNTINIHSKNFTWSTDFNISFNTNKILELASGQQSIISTVGFPTPSSQAQLYLAKVGGPAAVFYGYQWVGNYQLSDFDKQANGTYVLKADVPANGNPRANIQPGDIKYADIDNSGNVDDKDRVALGNAIPKHVGGLTNDFAYKGFALSVFFQWSYGNKILNANRDMFEGNPFTRFSLNQYATYNDRWTITNPSDLYYRSGGQGPAGRFSSRTLEDGSYLRLKTISLSYNIPAPLLKKIKVKAVNIYANAQNLYTWTKYSGMDPEVSVFNTILTPGFDYSAYPRQRTIVLGLKATL